MGDNGNHDEPKTFLRETNRTRADSGPSLSRRTRASSKERGKAASGDFLGGSSPDSSPLDGLALPLTVRRSRVRLKVEASLLAAG